MPPYFYHFLINIIVLLVSTKVVAWLFGRINIPSVLGEICAGIFLGPSVLNFITPTPILELLAEVGVVFLLFEVGLHTDITRLLKTGVKPILVACVGFILPLVLTFALMPYFQFSLLTTLFIGGTLAATSIGITMRVFVDLKKQHSHEAHIILGAAIVDDILGVLLLSVLYHFALFGTVSFMQFAQLSVSILLFIIVAPLLVKAAFGLLLRFLPARVFQALLLSFTLLAILLLSMLAHKIGAPTIIGGFVAGLALSEQFFWRTRKVKRQPPLFHFISSILSSEPHFFAALQKQIRPFVQIFSPIFFAMVGVMLNFKALQGTSGYFVGLSCCLFIVALLSKFAAGWVIREPHVIKMRVGVAMIPRGEVGLIFASLGFSALVLTPTLYASLILVVAFSTFLPPLLLKCLYRLGEKGA